ncbi:two-component system OmpR family sensor kinase [Kutzneria viridogrisea]|uniref:histidine kinase n=1 Tax=Kutzneria viridogrisea TaxID=47990 RepID=A0ABR6BPI8_9PSEU|nr:HAMP domain-containing sensor histidine kinase [Kutzneria albida]MBA8928522.1 two-component system OmpR family sensor kinase [Kutzneria viridogrisea]
MTRPWTLRTRLLVELVLLLAVVCVGIGVTAELALRGYLIGRVDDQLTQVNQKAHDRPPADRHPPGSSCAAFPPGQGTGTIIAQLSSNGVSAQIQDSSGCGVPLTGAAQRKLVTVQVDGHGHTTDLPGLGDYRFVTAQSPDGQVQLIGVPLREVQDTLANVAIVMTVVAVLGLVATGLGGALIVGVALRPLRRVAATATRVAELRLDRGEVALSERVPGTDRRTEVGQVGTALNRLLGHVADALAARHESETRVRQFVADASHELRTPLAAIRGYAELAARHRESVPPDVSHAMSRIQSESARMTTLVEDLLLLARLDSGRPLSTAEVDLSRLLVDAVSDAHVASPDHTWRLEVPAEPVTVTGDQAALHQVVANLLGNARTHTPPGSTVTAGIARTGGEVVITVADDGPGIPEPLQAEVFERFARGDTSRSRTAGSTGLGLAIVSAIVSAHHGTVSVDSEPGRTVFTVRLTAHV